MFEAEFYQQDDLAIQYVSQCNLSSILLESVSDYLAVLAAITPRMSQDHTQQSVFLHPCCTVSMCVREREIESVPDSSVHVKLFIRKNVSELCVFVLACQ